VFLLVIKIKLKNNGATKYVPSGFQEGYLELALIA
jgi:hypothetical protein